MLKNKFTKLIALGAGISLLASCATTSNVKKDSSTPSDSIIEIEETTTEKVRKEPKPIAVQNTSNQKEKAFKELLSNIDLKVISSESDSGIVSSSKKSEFKVSVLSTKAS